MASVLSIDGTPVNFPSTGTVLNRLVLSLDDADQLEFSQHHQTLPPTWHGGQVVELTIDGESIPHFKGQIVGPPQGFEQEGWTYGYRCLGLKQQMDLIVIRDPINLAGPLTYNRREGEDFFYNPSEAGLTTGEMIANVLDAHMDELNAYGIAGYVQADLDAMTITPPVPCTFENRLARAIEQFMNRWEGRHSMRVAYHAPTTDWRVRFVNSLAFAPTTLTFDVDPIDLDSFRASADVSDCFTRVVILGRGDIGIALVDTRGGTLVPTWDAGQQAEWRYHDFTEPTGAVSEGEIDALSSTSATLDPTDGAEEWDLNQWADNQGTLYLINNVATGVAFTEMRRVTSSGALTAGGTATVTWSLPLNTDGYTTYRMIGSPPNSLRWVWRKYEVNQDWVKDHLTTYFPFPVQWANGNTVQAITTPAGAVDWSNERLDSYGYVESTKLASTPMNFDIDRAEGTIAFYEPVVKANNGKDALDEGGSAVDPPYNVRAALAYVRGVLAAPCPAQAAGYGYGDELGAQYAGTAYTEWGIERTWYIYVETWLDEGDRPRMLELACMVLDTMKDIKWDGQVTYHGKYSAALALDMALNFEGGPVSFEYDTGLLATFACPVRSVVLEWDNDGADIWRTTLVFNNQRRYATGEDFYIHPSFAADPRFGGGFVGEHGDMVFDAMRGGFVPGGTAGLGYGPDLGMAGKSLFDPEAGTRGAGGAILPDLSGPFAGITAAGAAGFQGAMDLGAAGFGGATALGAAGFGGAMDRGAAGFGGAMAAGRFDQAGVGGMVDSTPFLGNLGPEALAANLAPPPTPQLAPSSAEGPVGMMPMMGLGVGALDFTPGMEVRPAIPGPRNVPSVNVGGTPPPPSRAELGPGRERGAGMVSSAMSDIGRAGASNVTGGPGEPTGMDAIQRAKLSEIPRSQRGAADVASMGPSSIVSGKTEDRPSVGRQGSMFESTVLDVGSGGLRDVTRGYRGYGRRP